MRHLLVTVQDISPRIELERKLHEERQRSQKEFEMLLKAIDADQALLRQFVARAEQPAGSQRHAAQHLRRAGRGGGPRRIDEARRRVHAVKGDAATLGLETLAAQAHAFEDELDRIRGAPATWATPCWPCRCRWRTC